MINVLDVETSTINKGSPYDPRNKLVSASLNSDFVYFTDPDFRSRLRSAYKGRRLVGFNIKFDIAWCVRELDDLSILDDIEIYDCQLAEFILSGQTTPYLSLNEALESYGLETKLDMVKEYWEKGISTENIPYEVVKEYNTWDTAQTGKLYEKQIEQLTEQQLALVLLQGEDLKTLVAAEFNGIKFDERKSHEVLDRCNLAVTEAESNLSGLLPALDSRAVFNWDSNDHLSVFLYGGTIEFPVFTEECRVYQSGPKKGESYTARKWEIIEVTFKQLFQPIPGTETLKSQENKRRYQVDEPTLKKLSQKATKGQRIILDSLARRAKVQKLAEMVSSLREKITTMSWTDNYIHPNYNQNVVVTGRLSSSNPNMQNQPPEIDELFVSRY